MANLLNVGHAINVYARQNQGRFPPNLGTLRNQHLLQPVYLVCPTSGTEPVNGDFVYDYVYIPGQSQDALPTNVLVYEKQPYHDDGGNVLFADLHVEYIAPYSRVEELVAETEARLADKD